MAHGFYENKGKAEVYTKDEIQFNEVELNFKVGGNTTFTINANSGTNMSCQSDDFGQDIEKIKVLGYRYISYSSSVTGDASIKSMNIRTVNNSTNKRIMVDSTIWNSGASPITISNAKIVVCYVKVG